MEMLPIYADVLLGDLDGWFKFVPRCPLEGIEGGVGFAKGSLAEGFEAVVF